MKRRGASFEHGPTARAPTLRPGEKLWRLKRRPGEDGRQATERARTMPWWGEVVTAEPGWTADYWLFIGTGAP